MIQKQNTIKSLERRVNSLEVEVQELQAKVYTAIRYSISAEWLAVKLGFHTAEQASN